MEPRDFHGFADSVSALSPVLGVIVRLHADAADGNSPDVEDWVRNTWDEYLECDATTEDEARKWWLAQYSVE